MSVLRNLLEVLQGVVSILSFVVMAVEVAYEGIEKAGEQKKQEVINFWKQIKPQVVSLVRDLFGNQVAEFVDKWLTEKVVGILIDILVWLFNKKEWFKKS